MGREYEPRKRSYEENSVVDMPFLINAPRALSETELKRKFPVATYSHYMDSFLRRRTRAVFVENSSAQWFKDRYFNCEEFDIYTGNVGKCIKLSGISASTPISDVICNVKTSFPTAKVLVSQGNRAVGFKRTIFVVDDKITPEDALPILKGSFDAEIIDVSQLKIDSSNIADYTVIKNLFEELLKYERRRAPHITDELISQTFSTNDVNCYSNFLRDNFYFCTYCCKKYDNQVEMHLRCSKHTPDDFCQRRNEILAYPKNFENAKKGIATLNSYYKITQEQNYMCKKCEKTFATVEFVETHIRNKHEEVALPNNDLMIEFLDNIDFFMFDIIFGTNERSVPHYGVCDANSDAVVYDIPCVFSGNIDLG